MNTRNKGILFFDLPFGSSSFPNSFEGCKDGKYSSERLDTSTVASPYGAGKVRVIDETQAAIVREIFERYTHGDGLRKICKSLSGRGILPPRAGKRGTGSWSPGSIHEMLRRERYRGILVWGKMEKTYRGGTKVRVSRDAKEWTTTEIPELRIIDESLWNALKSRHESRKRITGRTTYGPRVKHMLSGIGRCAQCGGPMRSDNGKISYENVRVYNCAWRRDRGGTVCKNGLRRPIAAVDAALLKWIRTSVA